MMLLSMDIAGTLLASPASSQERYRKYLSVMHKGKKKKAVFSSAGS